MRGKVKLTKSKKAANKSRIKSGIAKIKTHVNKIGHRPVPGDAGIMSAKMVAYAKYKKDHRIGKTKKK